MSRTAYPEHSRKVAVLGRGGAGKSVLSRQLSEATGLPLVELDAVFWQDGLEPVNEREWTARQAELLRRPAWILDGDLGPYDFALDARLGAADAVVVLNFGFLRCAWRTLRRGSERADYWRWVWSYRRRALPVVLRSVNAHASRASVHVLRNPAAVRRFIDSADRR